jgi:hypothetical protein
MNIINAGNPSANNMIVRQVMQKKRESSATILDKLNKRTAQLTAQNPLNNILTNDQLFRYYIKEVEPKLSQSNDNFSGLPNMTPPDNSIKDTTEKGFGNGKDEYNAGSGGGGGFGPLNSNDISKMTPIGQSVNLYEYLDGRVKSGENQGVVTNEIAKWYLNDRENFNKFIRDALEYNGLPINKKNIQKAQLTWLNILGINPYDAPYFEKKAGNPDNHNIQDQYVDFLDDFTTEFFTDLANETLQEERGLHLQEPQEAPFDLSHLVGPRDPSRHPPAPQELKNPSVRQHAQDLGLNADESVYHDAEDNSSQAGVSLYYEEAGSPVKTFVRDDLYQLQSLFSLEQLPINVGSRRAPLARVSDIHVPKDVAVAGGAEKKQRAPPGTNSSTKPPDPDFRSLDLTATPPVASRTKSKTTGTHV